MSWRTVRKWRWLRAPRVVLAGALVVLMLAGALLGLRVSSPPGPPVPPPGSEEVSGPLRAPGGPFLVDRFGRVVILHGVNAVYKLPPFELYPDPGQPWDFSASDAASIARLGFDVVRLGILWQGLEPGTLGPDSPQVCTQGRPGNPHQFDQSVLDAYLDEVTRTVDLLGGDHVYTLLDMHQDVYNQLFEGEGAPAWAVCTSGVPNALRPGRWSNNYSDPAADVAYAHFWSNDVVGNLQGEYDRVWAAVAAHFAHNPWILGYDLYNEPFSRSLEAVSGRQLDPLLECFYTGRAHPGELAGSTSHVSCPPGDPEVGLIPSILHADPHHLIFYEPDIFSSRGEPNLVGPMDYPNLVLGFHDYCSFRSGVTGDPTDLAACAAQELGTIEAREGELTLLGTPSQPGGPAWFMGEFGATTSTPLLQQLTSYADRFLLGWTYWQWKYYQDPTGSSDEALVTDEGALRPNAAVLAQPYPQAVAGTPTAVSVDPRTGLFLLSYLQDPGIRAPTIVLLPSSWYPHGYCASVSGGRVISSPGADRLLVEGSGSGTVAVSVARGSCPRG